MAALAHCAAASLGSPLRVYPGGQERRGMGKKMVPPAAMLVAGQLKAEGNVDKIKVREGELFSVLLDG